MGRDQVNRMDGDHYHVLRSQNMQNYQCVGGCIVMMENPAVVLSLLWTFIPNVHM